MTPNAEPTAAGQEETTSTTTTDNTSVKKPMFRGTEAIIWHMMNDMQYAATPRQDDIKETTEEEEAHVNSRQRRGQCISKHWVQMTIGIAFIFVLIIVAILVSEMSKWPS